MLKAAYINFTALSYLSLLLCQYSLQYSKFNFLTLINVFIYGQLCSSLYTFFFL